MTIHVPAHRVSVWVHARVKNPPLPTKFHAESKAEMVELIPYGSTGLRVTVFPETPDNNDIPRF